MARLPKLQKKQNSRVAARTKKLPPVLSTIARYDGLSTYNTDAKQQETTRNRNVLDKNYAVAYQKLNSEIDKTTNSLYALTENFNKQINVLERIRDSNTSTADFTKILGELIPTVKKPKTPQVKEPTKTGGSKITSESTKEKISSTASKIAKGGLAAAKLTAAGLGPLSLIISGYEVINELNDIENDLSQGKINSEEYKKKYAETLGSFLGGVAGTEILGTVGAALGLPLGGIGALVFGTVGGVSGFFAGKTIGMYVGQYVANKLVSDATQVEPPQPLDMNEETQKQIKENLKDNAVRDKFDPATLLMLDQIAAADLKSRGSASSKMKQLIPEAAETFKRNVIKSSFGTDNNQFNRIVFDADNITIEAANYKFSGADIGAGVKPRKRNTTGLIQAAYTPDTSLTTTTDNVSTASTPAAAYQNYNQSSTNSSSMPQQSISGTNSTTTETGEVGDVGKEEMTNAAEVIDFFVGKGWTQEQAIGIAANISHETGGSFKNTTKERGGDSYGLAQWRGSRLKDLEKFAGKPYNQTSVKEQLNFIQHELMTSESKSAKFLKEAKTPEDAADVFNRYYERSADKDSSKRIKIAQQYAKMQGNNQTPVNNKSSTGINLNQSSTSAEALRTAPKPVDVTVPINNSSSVQNTTLVNSGSKSDIDLRTRAIQTLAA